MLLKNELLIFHIYFKPLNTNYAYMTEKGKRELKNVVITTV